MISLILTTLIVFHGEYQCRLSWYEEDKCVYQCQNSYEQFTWVIGETKDGCPLFKKFYKAQMELVNVTTTV